MIFWDPFLGKQFLIASGWLMLGIFSLQYWLIFVKILPKFIKIVDYLMKFRIILKENKFLLVNFYEIPSQKPWKISKNYSRWRFSMVKIIYFSKNIRNHRYILRLFIKKHVFCLNYAIRRLKSITKWNTLNKVAEVWNLAQRNLKKNEFIMRHTHKYFQL